MIKLGGGGVALPNTIYCLNFNLSRPLPTLVLRRLRNAGDVRMVPQIVAQRPAQDPHAGSMHDADARQPRKKSAV